jgi:hypothetical protein
MSTSLGTLLIILQAETSAFARGMSDAKKLAFTTSGEIVESVKKIAESMTKLKFGNLDQFAKSAGIVGGLLAGVGVAVAAASIEVAKGTAEQAKEMEKLSQAYGLPVEMVSQLRVAAKLTGVPLDELTRSMGRLARNALLAAEGGKSQNATFAALGVKVTDAHGKLLPMNELLPQVAERFSKMENGTAKTAIAIQLFGRSGAAIIPFLNRGAEGIRQLQEISDQLGLTWTEKDIKAAVAFHESMEIMDLKSQALKENFVKGLLPALDQLTTAFVKTNTGGKSVAQTLGETIGTALKYTVIGVDSLITEFRELFTIFRLLATVTVADTIAPWKFKDLGKMWAETKNELSSIEQGFQDRAHAILNGKPLDLGSDGGAGGVTPPIPNLTKQTDKGNLGDLLRQATEIFDRKNPLQEQIDRIKELQAKIADFKAAHPNEIFLDLNAAGEKLAGTLGILVAQQARFASGQATMGDLGKDAFKGLEEFYKLPARMPQASGAVQVQASLIELQTNPEEQNRERAAIYEQTRTAAQRYADELAKLNLLYSDHSSQEYLRAVENLKETVLGVYDPTMKYRKELEQLHSLQPQNAADQAAIAAAIEKTTRALKEAQAQQVLETGQGGGLAGFKVALQENIQDWKNWATQVHNATREAFAGIQSSFSTFLSGMAIGTKSIGQLFSELGRNLVTSMVNALANMLAKWITTHIEMLLVKTTTDQAQVASTAASQAESTQIHGANALKRIGHSAAEAAAHAFKWVMSSVPFPINIILAPLAAAGAFAGVMAFGALASAAGGMEVDRDQLAFVHKDEKILPARISRGFDNIINSFRMPATSGQLAPAAAGTGQMFGDLNFNVNGATNPGATAAKIQRVVTSSVMRNLRRKM